MADRILRPGIGILGTLALAVMLGLGPAPGTAQSGNPFAPAVVVNDKAITNFELSQRARILALFQTPGDLLEVAREQLIDERLQLFAAQRIDLRATEEEVAAGMSEFASRANLSTEEFVTRLEQAGVAPATYRDFVEAGVTWRKVIRARFGNRATVTEADVDHALALTSRPGTAEALISEIILPARSPAEGARAERIAAQLTATVTSSGGFAAAARQYSASPSRASGGRVPQPLPLQSLPPAIAAELVSLQPGEISNPIPIPNAIALFQLRELRDTGRPEVESVLVEYAQYFIPGGRSPEALAAAQRISLEIDTCKDLYGVNLGQPPERLVIETKPVPQVPADIALELAKLDEGETSVALTRGESLMLLVLCSRTEEREEPIDRDLVRRRLLDQRLAGYATSYLAELKANAIIREP